MDTVLSYHDIIKQVQRLSEHIEYEHIRILGQPFSQPIFKRRDQPFPTFEPCDFDLSNPGRIGTLGGLDIIIDDLLKEPRMKCSDGFKRTQTPELVKKTQEWMGEFFGYTYPIHKIGNRLLMHRKAYEELRFQMTNNNYMDPTYGRVHYPRE